MPCRRTLRRGRGYALIMALILVAAASFAAMIAVTDARTSLQREREAQLLFVGDQYRRALQSYAAVAPAGGIAQYPSKLDELLEDKRFPNPVRHLRRLYVDPMTGAADWELERSQGRIIGLHSRSKLAPLRRANFPDRDAAFADARSYADWRFTAVASSGDVAAGAAGGPAATARPGAAPASATGPGATAAPPDPAPQRPLPRGGTPSPSDPPPGDD
ncbi:MAG TPA: type II secretion system protein [Burkholderiaceae bacterium]|nr:type II secretion system protein [Burkholderiaceae bacterium]